MSFPLIIPRVYKSIIEPTAHSVQHPGGNAYVTIDITPPNNDTWLLFASMHATQGSDVTLKASFFDGTNEYPLLSMYYAQKHFVVSYTPSGHWGYADYRKSLQITHIITSKMGMRLGVIASSSGTIYYGYSGLALGTPKIRINPIKVDPKPLIPMKCIENAECVKMRIPKMVVKEIDGKTLVDWIDEYVPFVVLVKNEAIRFDDAGNTIEKLSIYAPLETVIAKKKALEEGEKDRIWEEILAKSGLLKR